MTANEPTETISRSKWRRLGRDYRTGDPRRGTAAILKFVPGKGTCLVAVKVVDDAEAGK